MFTHWVCIKCFLSESTSLPIGGRLGLTRFNGESSESRLALDSQTRFIIYVGKPIG